MEEKFDLVTDVNPKKLQSHFKVYVVRIWEVPSKYNEKEIASIEIILQDAKGGRIHCTIPRGVGKKMAWCHS
ncbi:hypothetical protein Ahy_A07g033621 [Arachis hypogaea]|uniref:Replication protein A 70 kDa DNA-binding subunit B/D first OB fold domain-containing protein n=1 Tax=Arachis hypogaea TaxID=3818 RepID=A0A445C9Q3_ARAHY|nr:hypothetical protein Ahy_A07g033621 [Arachis hypogaea]